MRDRSDLFAEQRGAVEEIVRSPERAVLWEVGYGKTAVTQTALLDLDAFPALVVAPARVARTTWQDEAREWSHLSGLNVTALVGDADRRTIRLAHRFDIATVSYENLLWLTDTCDIEARFKSIVFDELSKMKAPGTKRYRRMRARCMKIPVRVGLTGTPVPNHLLDLWGEMFMVAGAKPLGSTYSDYKMRYFEPKDYFQRVWELKGSGDDGRPTPISRQVEAEIHRRVRPFVIPPPPPSPRVPPLRVNSIRGELPARVARLGEQLVEELRVQLDSGIELEALQASTVAVKLRQFASGAVYTDKDCSKWEELHTEKLDALDDVLDEMQGEPVLVFYWYEHEKQRIAERLRRAGRRFAFAGDEAFRRWNARELEVLIVHPASAGHGLNLQHGGHTIVWYTLPFSNELWKQGNGRLARTGQKAATVMVHCLLWGAADTLIQQALLRKGATEKALFQGVSAFADLL